jgi:hypothetical protein
MGALMGPPESLDQDLQREVAEWDAEAVSVFDREDHALGWMEPRPQANRKVLDLVAHVDQVALVVGEHQKVIDVTDVALDPQPLLNS